MPLILSQRSGLRVLLAFILAIQLAAVLHMGHQVNAINSDYLPTRENQLHS